MNIKNDFKKAKGLGHLDRYDEDKRRIVPKLPPIEKKDYLKIHREQRLIRESKVVEPN